METRRRLGSVLCIVVALGVCAIAGSALRGAELTSAFAGPEDADSIAGRVVDAATGSPIAGASVQLWRRSTALRAESPELQTDGLSGWPTKPTGTARTDAKGTFTFVRDPHAPLLWVTISATGYFSEVEDVTANRGEYVVPLEAGTPWSRRLVTTVGLETKPVRGAEVLLFPARTMLPLGARFTTGEDGRVTVPAGPDAVVVVRGEGIATSEIRRSWDADAVQIIPAAAPIAGVVRGADGAPIRGVRVSVEPGAFEIVAWTDVRGGFRLDGVPCDSARHLLRITGPGGLSARIPASAGDMASDVVLRQGVTVRGRVLDVDGKPAARIRVTDSGVPGAGPDDDDRFATSGADGWFEIVGVPMGHRVFCAEAADSWSAAADIVTVGADTASAAIVLRLRRKWVPVTVRVLDERTHAPVRGVGVRNRSTNSERVTDNDGVAVITAVPDDTFGEASIDLAGGPLGPRKKHARLSRAALARGHADVALTTTTPLRLRVVGPDGAVRPPATYEAFVTEDALEYDLATDATRVDVPSAEFILVPGAHDFRLHVGMIEDRGAARHESVHRLADAKDGVLEVRLGRAASVSARLAKGASGEGGTVSVRAWTSEPPRRPPLFSGVLGDLVGDGVRVRVPSAGRWTLHVVRETAAGTRTIACRTFDVRAGQDVELGEIGGLDVLIRGTVRSDGLALPGARVSVDSGLGDDNISVSTGPDGSYVLRVPRGVEGTLVVGRVGRGTVGRPFRADADATVDLTVGPAARLLIRNARDAVGLRIPLTIRSAGTERLVDFGLGLHDALVDGIAAGDVEIVARDPDGERRIQAVALPGKVVEVDLGAK